MIERVRRDPELDEHHRRLLWYIAHPRKSNLLSVNCLFFEPSCRDVKQRLRESALPPADRLFGRPSPCHPSTPNYSGMVSSKTARLLGVSFEPLGTGKTIVVGALAGVKRKICPYRMLWTWYTFTCFSLQPRAQRIQSYSVHRRGGELVRLCYSSLKGSPLCSPP